MGVTETWMCRCGKTEAAIEFEKMMTGCREHDGECCDCGDALPDHDSPTNDPA